MEAGIAAVAVVVSRIASVETTVLTDNAVTVVVDTVATVDADESSSLTDDTPASRALPARDGVAAVTLHCFECVVRAMPSATPPTMRSTRAAKTAHRFHICCFTFCFGLSPCAKAPAPIWPSSRERLRMFSLTLASYCGGKAGLSGVLVLRRNCCCMPACAC